MFGIHVFDTKSEEKLSTVIIGCGDIAGGYDERTEKRYSLTHAGAFLRHGAFDLTACIEPNKKRRDAFIDYWGVRSCYPDLATCREDTGMHFDVASICAPTEFHTDYITKLSSDPVRLIFCEKPMGENYEAAQSAVAECDQVGKPLIVNYLRRWFSEFSELGDQLRAGKFGRVQNITVRYSKGLLHGGSHALDLLHFFFGTLRVDSILGIINDGRSKDQTVNVLLRTNDNAPVFFIGTDYRQYSLFEIDISASGGRVIIDNLGERLRSYISHDSEEFPGHAGLHLEEQKNIKLFFAMDHAVAGIYDMLRGLGGVITSTGHSALDTHAICNSILRLEAE